MMEMPEEPRSPVTPSGQADSDSPQSDTDTAGRAVAIAPETTEIDLGIDPVAYHYESWSEMADGWVESSRSSAKTMPDPDHEQIRNVTPLVPLEDVEDVIERMIMAGEIIMPSDRTDAP